MINQPRKSHFYDFGSFRLDVSNRLLLRDGEHVPLTQKSFDILSYLIRNRNRMLRKQELLDEIWNDRYVEEANLAQHIYMVRKALRNNGSTVDYIETIPKFGYRFNANVSESYADARDPEAEQEAGASAIVRTGAQAADIPLIKRESVAGRPHRSPVPRKRIAFLLTTAALSAMMVTLVSIYMIRQGSTTGSRQLTSIAVLPFTQIGGEQDGKLGTGIAETLISRLGNSYSISILPAASAARAGFAGESPIETGRRLGVDAILTGTVQREGNRVRVNVQLVSVQERVPLWADKVDVDYSDIFTLQDQISHQVVEKLASRLGPGVRPPASEQAELHNEAIQAFAKGTYFWKKRTGENLKIAIGHLEDAVRLDPEFAEAYALLADSYSLAAVYGVDVLPETEAVEKAREFAARAIAIDPRTSAAYSALAVVANYERDAARAAVHLRKAIALDSGNAVAHLRLAWIYASEEDLEKAIHEMKLAQKADPDSQVINLNLARLLRLNRQTDEALEVGKRAVELDPAMMWTRVILAEIYEQKGMLDESIKELRSVPRSAPEQKTARLLISRVLAKKGNRTEARKILKDLTAADTDSAPAYEVATVYALLGDQKEAVRELQETQEDSLIHYLHLKYDYNLDPLRDNPEYPGILSQSRQKFKDSIDKNS